MLEPKELSLYTQAKELEYKLKSEENQAQAEILAGQIKQKLIEELRKGGGFSVFKGGQHVIYTPKSPYLDDNHLYDFIYAPAAIIVSDWLKSKGFSTDVRWEGLGADGNPVAQDEEESYKYSRAGIFFWVDEEEKE